VAELLLKVRNLSTYFFTDNGIVKAVDGVSLDIHRGEIVGLVGESGWWEDGDRSLHHASYPLSPGAHRERRDLV
jgi:ABC-type dipeptide/oligopeptide/nickel transport system, ATPase component